MNQISIRPTNPNFEDIGFDLVLRPEDIAALRRLQKLQAQDPANGWFVSSAFMTERNMDAIAPYIHIHWQGIGQSALYRLNAFGRFVLAWTEGNAYVDITFNSGVE